MKNKIEIEEKEYYKIEDIEEYLFRNYNCKKFKKLKDMTLEWEENSEDCEDVFDYTDGVIFEEQDYYIYVVKSDVEDETRNYNEIFIACSKLPNVPDRMFGFNGHGVGNEIDIMIKKNIEYILSL